MSEEQTVEYSDEEIHLPSPSAAPIVVATGATLTLTGIVSPVLLALGAVILLAGIGIWAFGD